MSHASAERFAVHLGKTTEYAWLQKNGSYIHPIAMSFDHLRHTLAMIRRWGNYEKLQRELYCLAGLSSVMGDGAYDAVSSEAHCLSVNSPHAFCMDEVPIYKAMYKEFSRRAMG